MAEELQGKTLEMWQVRVLRERDDLTDKIHKLSEFLSSSQVQAANGDEVSLLKEQRVVMLEYQRLLTDRIDRWK